MRQEKFPWQLPELPFKEPNNQDPTLRNTQNPDNTYIITQLKVGISLCYPPAIMYLCLHCQQTTDNGQRTTDNSQQTTVNRQQSMVKDVRDLKDVRDPKDSPSYKHLENHEL